MALIGKVIPQRQQLVSPSLSYGTNRINPSNARDADNVMTKLFNAIEAADLEQVKAAIGKGADVNKPMSHDNITYLDKFDNSTPLMFVFKQMSKKDDKESLFRDSKLTEIWNYFLKLPELRLDATTRNGQNILHFAFRKLSENSNLIPKLGNLILGILKEISSRAQLNPALKNIFWQQDSIAGYTPLVPLAETKPRQDDNSFFNGLFENILDESMRTEEGIQSLCCGPDSLPLILYVCYNPALSDDIVLKIYNLMMISNICKPTMFMIFRNGSTVLSSLTRRLKGYDDTKISSLISNHLRFLSQYEVGQENMRALSSTGSADHLFDTLRSNDWVNAKTLIAFSNLSVLFSGSYEIIESNEKSDDSSDFDEKSDVSTDFDAKFGDLIESLISRNTPAEIMELIYSRILRSFFEEFMPLVDTTQFQNNEECINAINKHYSSERPNFIPLKTIQDAIEFIKIESRPRCDEIREKAHQRLNANKARNTPMTISKSRLA